MLRSKTKLVASVMCAVAVVVAAGAVAFKLVPDPDAPFEDYVSPYTAEQFDRVAALVRPLPGEYAWHDDIPWETRIQSARIRAAAEDKPILILAAANSYPLGRT